MSLAVAKRYLKCDHCGCDMYLNGDGKEVRIVATDFFTYKEHLTSISIQEAIGLGININNLRRFTRKFYRVSFIYTDNSRGETYTEANTPAEALASAKMDRPACKKFRVSKKVFNTLGYKW